jgi:hypothetical protein
VAGIRAACERVLTDPGYRARARAEQRQFLALPDAHAAVDDLGGVQPADNERLDGDR